ncbi:O-antigen ligase family protein [Vibrio sp. RC27]
MWFASNGLKTLSGLSFLSFIFSFSNKESYKSILSSKIIIYLTFFTITLIFIDKLHGGIFSSLNRSLVCFIFLYSAYKNTNISNENIIRSLMLGILIQVIYLLYLLLFFDFYNDIPKNPNIYSALLGSIIIYLSYNLYHQFSYKILFITIIITFLIFSLESRTVIFSCFTSIPILYSLKILNFKKRTIFLTLFIFSASYSILSEPVSRIYNVTTYELRNLSTNDYSSSLGQRYSMALLGWDMFKEKPLTGYGSDFFINKNILVEERELSQNIKKYATLHNIYIDSLAKLGIFSLPVTIFVTLIPLLYCYKGTNRKFGISLSTYMFLISIFDTALLGGPLLLVIICLCLATTLNSYSTKNE